MEAVEQAIAPKTEARQPEKVVSHESVRKASLDAVVVCGMGPVKLTDIKGSERLFSAQPYNRPNAIAAKLLASNGFAERVIVSGTRSAKAPEGAALEGVDLKAVETSEAELLADTFDRARGKGVSPEGAKKAGEVLSIDTNAKTTFGNIIEGLNMLDEQNGGYWEGKLAVLSADFHALRINEMIKAFGLKARVLTAEGILEANGYNPDKFYPEGDFGYGVSYETFEKGVYSSQPAGLQNLQDNPSYVTFEMARVVSNKRLQEMASSVKHYYQAREVPLPPVYDQIPQTFDEAFDYARLREQLGGVPFSKHPYTGREFQGEEGAGLYRKLAQGYRADTIDYIKSLSPNT